MNRKSAREISFKYRIEVDTAEPADFTSAVLLDTEIAGTIDAKNSTLDIVIDIKDDGLVEPDETFNLILSDVTGANFDPAGDTLTAIGTITSADIPSLSVAESFGDEKDDVTFTLTLDQTPIDAVSFKYRIVAGTALQADFADTVQLGTEMDEDDRYWQGSTLDIVVVGIEDDSET